MVVVVGSTWAPPGSSPKDGERIEPNSWNGIDWERGGKRIISVKKGTEMKNHGFHLQIESRE